MRMTLAVLSAPATARPERIDPSVVVDILWTVTRPDDLIEHIHVRTGHGRVEMAFFLRGDQAVAADTVSRLCRRAERSSPLLRGWALHIHES